MTLAIIAAILIAATIGVETGSGLLALLAGVGIVLVSWRLKVLARDLQALRLETESLRRALAVSGARSSPSMATPAAEDHPVAEPAVSATAPSPDRTTPPPPLPDAPPAAWHTASTPSAPEETRPAPRAAEPNPAWREFEHAERAPGVAERIGSVVKRWFTEGNVPVKIGMLVLFAGIAALLKLAADQGWFTLPIEFRLAGIALVAIGGLAFGWRQRHTRRSFGLALQGGAIGVLLMTVFAAFRLYPLLSPEAAFALLLALVAGAGVLAVLQDAIALAVLAILAGFAAPILISTGSGNHVVLFSYYAVLNLAILAIAWLRSWRVLNLLGFFFTYAIGTAWGVLRYRSDLFDSTEPFLLLYFAIYLAIPILNALRGEPSRRSLVDGTLVFGNPLIAFALQAALLEGERLPLAYSALAVAAIHAALAWLLRQRARLLADAFAVVAVGFATLSVPLALSARATACAFALEGAGLVWLGLRQQRRLPQFTGLVLQVLAAAAFAVSSLDPASIGTVAFANGLFTSALLIAVAAFASAWLYSRAPTHLAPLALGLYLWGLLWWFSAGANEIERFLAPALHPSANLAFSAISALIAAIALHHVPSRALAWTTAVLVAAGVLLVLPMGSSPPWLTSPPALAALAAYAIGGSFALFRLRDGEELPLRLAHLGWLWTWTSAAALLLSRMANTMQLADGWADALAAVPLIAAFAIALRRPRWLAPPLGERFDNGRGLLLATQALASSLAIAGLLFLPGSSAPLPFIPLLNPLELAQLALLACLVRWCHLTDGVRDARWTTPLLALAAFTLATMATLRAVHHLGDVPWDEGLWDSNLAQTALTVVWSLAGVAAWILGSRRRQHLLWLAGAVLMGVVLLKLLLIDRDRLGNLFGIASFIAYGLLCTVVGYFAPAPPRDAKVEGA